MFLFHGNVGMAIVFFITLTGLILATFACLKMQTIGVYFGVTTVFLGASWLAVLVQGVPLQDATACLAILAIFGGALYLLLFFTLTIIKKRKEKNAERQAYARRLQYTLPDRENSYVRTRLNTVLRVEEPPETRATIAQKYFRLEHARNLLRAVQEKPLSAVERLETDELSALFSLYAKKEKINSDDLQMLNDAFSRVLKLSAKHDVCMKNL